MSKVTSQAATIPRYGNPSMINTDKYYFSHGKAPRGYGMWIFDIGGTTFNYTGNWQKARKAAIKEARRLKKLGYNIFRPIILPNPISSRAATDPTYVSPGFPNPKRRHKRNPSAKATRGMTGELMLLGLAAGIGYLVWKNRA